MKRIEIILTEKDLHLLRKGGSIEVEGDSGERVYVAAAPEAQTLNTAPMAGQFRQPLTKPETERKQ